jgi:hypothetical protein
LRSQILLSCVILLGLLTVPAFAQQVTAPKNLDHPGIKWDWKIKAENYTFDVATVSNYDMKNVTFNKINKELIFTGNSTHDGNIAEIDIPTNLIGGNLTVVQNGKPVSAIVIPGTDSSTIMLKFNQTGTLDTNVFGTTYLPEFSSVTLFVMVLSVTMVLFIPRLGKF